MHVSAQDDQSVNALTTQLTGHATLQLRLTNGAYSAEHLHHIAHISADHECPYIKILLLQEQDTNAEANPRLVVFGLGAL